MNLLTFQNIAVTNKLVNFTTKSYSLELLFILETMNGFEGMDKLFLTIVSPRPKYPAFKTYLYFLKYKECIEILDGKTKNSSKYIKLTSEVKKEFYDIFKNI